MLKLFIIFIIALLILATIYYMYFLYQIKVTERFLKEFEERLQEFEKQEKIYHHKNL